MNDSRRADEIDVHSDDRLRPSVLVLMGGPDAERQVSLMSGREVAAALRRCGAFDVIEAVIDRPGAEALAELGGDVVFPVLHGQWGEGGGLQRELERLERPYVGAGPRAAALAMDKLASKSRLIELGFATPQARILLPEEPCDLDPPLVLKPVDDGSSVDLAVCTTDAEIAAARERIHPRRGRLLAERFVAGREITVGILIDRTLPLVEIVPAEGLYDYAAKYERDDTRYEIDPPLPAGLADRCRVAAMAAFRALGCRDLARVDFIVDEREAWFLEINTMPGFTTHSLVPMAAAAEGMLLPDLCRILVEHALRRSQRTAADR